MKGFTAVSKKHSLLDSTPSGHYTTEEIDAVDIHIPNHRIDDFLWMTDDQKYREMEIKDQVHGIKVSREPKKKNKR